MSFANQWTGEHKQQPSTAKLPSGPSRWAAMIVAILMLMPACAQENPAIQATSPRHHSTKPVASQHQQQGPLSPEEIEKYKPLMDEVGQLIKKIKDNVQLPPARTQSKLLPLVPSTSSFYVAIPNFGDVLQHVNQIFLDDLKDSPRLNDWWQNKVGPEGPLAEQVIQKVHQFTGFLGNEIVLTGNISAKGPTVLFFAEVRKPGLKAFLDQIMTQYGGSKPPIRVLTPQQLLTAKAPADKEPLVLLRPDYVAVASDLVSLRTLNAQLNRGGGGFATTAFGQRLAQAYPSGAVVVGGLDLQKLLALRPQGNPVVESLLQQSGFGDVKYLILESKYLAGLASGSMELSFNGPRQGIASWLAAPGPLQGMEFVSKDAAYAVTYRLKPPGQIFDDIKRIAESINPMAGASIDQADAMLKIKLKDDLFNKFSGQFTVAFDGPVSSKMPWKVIAQVLDPEGLQRTLKQLIAVANENSKSGSVDLDQQSEGGITYYAINASNGPKELAVHYAFADGYMILGESHDRVKDAIALHRNGDSLTRSSEFQSLLPAEHSNQASALLYQNSSLWIQTLLRQVNPELLKYFPSGGETQRVVGAAYGEDSLIRFVSKSRGFDAGLPLLWAAIVIPNIMRSKTAADEGAAAANVKTLITAEVQYSVTYDKGYAPNLAALGPGPQGTCNPNGPTAGYACLIDPGLGCDGAWCNQGNFRYNVTASCKEGNCDDYVVVGTPASPGGQAKSFCATSDAVVRSKMGPALSDPPTVSECQSWSPI